MRSKQQSVAGVWLSQRAIVRSVISTTQTHQYPESAPLYVGKPLACEGRPLKRVRHNSIVQIGRVLFPSGTLRELLTRPFAHTYQVLYSSLIVLLSSSACCSSSLMILASVAVPRGVGTCRIQSSASPRLWVKRPRSLWLGEPTLDLAYGILSARPKIHKNANEARLQPAVTA